MLKGFKIINPKNEALELVLDNPEKSGIIVTKVEGLGPPQATINGQELATSDGMIYSSSKIGTRNIVFYLNLIGRTSDSKYGEINIEETRNLTYKFFPLKKEIKIYIITTEKTLFCTGRVESNEPDIFSQNESCQISIICPDPYLYTDGEGKTVFSGIRGVFEFPFSNEMDVDKNGIIVSSPKLLMGEIWLSTDAILEYEGTVDTGLLITIHAYDIARNIVIYNIDTRERMVIDTDKIYTITGTSYKGLDDIIISTVKGKRYCRLLRDGQYINIIGTLSKDADWFQITSGRNGFAFGAESGANNLSVTFSYQNAYIAV